MAILQENMPEVLAEVIRDSSTRIRLERTTFKGEELLCLREYFTRNGLEWFPTKRGVNLKRCNWQSIILPAVQKALSAQ